MKEVLKDAASRSIAYRETIESRDVAPSADAIARLDGVLEPTPEKGYYYRSDHFSFAKLGVPMIYFEGGEDLIDGGREAGEAISKDYTDNRYHGPKDE